MNTKRNKNKREIHKLEKLAGEELSFGSLIKAIRLGEEMTQTEFAKMLRTSKQYLCDVERGRKIVSPKKAASYARLLGYSEKQFLRLCLQDILKRDGFDLTVSVEAA